MSSLLQSDEETLDQFDPHNLEILVRQNRMKDVALAKASNLIELLNQELQSERQAKEEELRSTQEQICRRFSRELEVMREKIEFLERELKRSAIKAVKHEKGLNNSESSKSIDGKKKRSLNKKYTEGNRLGTEQSQACRNNSVRLAYLEGEILNMEDWRNMTLEILEEYASQENNKLRESIDELRQMWDELQQSISSDLQGSEIYETINTIYKQREEAYAIIMQQQQIIWRYKTYSRELEELIIDGLQKIGSGKIEPDLKRQSLQIEDLVFDAKIQLGRVKNIWEREFSRLQIEKMELISILDGIVGLVQEERKARI